MKTKVIQLFCFVHACLPAYPPLTWAYTWAPILLFWAYKECQRLVGLLRGNSCKGGETSKSFVAVAFKHVIVIFLVPPIIGVMEVEVEKEVVKEKRSSLITNYFKRSAEENRGTEIESKRAKLKGHEKKTDQKGEDKENVHESDDVVVLYEQGGEGAGKEKKNAEVGVVEPSSSSAKPVSVEEGEWEVEKIVDYAWCCERVRAKEKPRSQC